MRFVVDETSWIFDGLDPKTCVEMIEEMLDRLDDAQEHGHACYYSDELFKIAVRDCRTFYELYEANSPLTIPQDVRQRVAVAFSRLQTWQELDAFLAN
jgi:hypothetical protein